MKWFVYHVIRYNDDVLYVGKKEGSPVEGEHFHIDLSQISPRVIEIMKQDQLENKSFSIGIVEADLSEEEANKVMAESL